ncbi:hypothetical protein ACFL6C_00880 [Myxococcota bacterium]
MTRRRCNISRRVFLKDIGTVAAGGLVGLRCVGDVNQNGHPGDTHAGDPASAGDPSNGSDSDCVCHYTIDIDLCNGCSKCVEPCTRNAIFLQGDCETRIEADPGNEMGCYWQCRGPCIDACTQSAIEWSSVDPKYMVAINPDLCICCGDCAAACTWNIIKRDSDRIALIDPCLCDDCGECVVLEFCPDSAILFRP